MKHTCQHKFNPDGQVINPQPKLTAKQLNAAYARLTEAMEAMEAMEAKRIKYEPDHK